MARMLGIDYGMKKTGLSVTDPLQIIVNVLDLVETLKLFDFLVNYFEREAVEKIVIGQPLHADGTPTYLEEQILRFIKKINSKFPEIEIARQDEYLSSVEAKEIILKSGVPKMKRRNKALVDKISAVIILQRYLGHI